MKEGDKPEHATAAATTVRSSLIAATTPRSDNVPNTTNGNKNNIIIHQPQQQQQHVKPYGSCDDSMIPTTSNITTTTATTATGSNFITTAAYHRSRTTKDDDAAACTVAHCTSLINNSSNDTTTNSNNNNDNNNYYCDYIVNHHPNDIHHHYDASSTAPPPDDDNDDDDDIEEEEEYYNDTCWTGIRTQQCQQNRRNKNKPIICCGGTVTIRIPTIRQMALTLSLYCNIAITISKFIAYLQTYSLSVLAALLDSVLDVISQVVLNYTEHRSNNNDHDDNHNNNNSDNHTKYFHSNNSKRSSAHYPAGASRLEPIGVLTCAALMGMASFEVLKQSTISLFYPSQDDTMTPQLSSVYNMVTILCIKLILLWLCRRGANKRYIKVNVDDDDNDHNGTNHQNENETVTPQTTNTDVDHHSNTRRQQQPVHDKDEYQHLLWSATSNTKLSAASGNTIVASNTTGTATTATTNTNHHHHTNNNNHRHNDISSSSSPPPQPPKQPKQQQQNVIVQFADPTLEALGQDHYNDCLSNGVAAVALLCTYYSHSELWFIDPIGAIIISIYIIYSWYMTGKEQIEHLTGRSAPIEFIQELIDMANAFDERITVDTVRAYHFGPKFLVEIEIVMHATTLLYESHDLGMDLQYEIEGREEVERCFVHIDYQIRPYDEHVVSKVPELREKFLGSKLPSSHSI